MSFGVHHNTLHDFSLCDISRKKNAMQMYYVAVVIDSSVRKSKPRTKTRSTSGKLKTPTDEELNTSPLINSIKPL